MGKLLTVLLIAVVAGAGYLLYARSHPELAACMRVADLCGSSQGDSRHACEEAFSAMKKAGGLEEAAHAGACVSEAQSCPAAMGCIVAGAGRAAAGAAGEFLKGLTK